MNPQWKTSLCRLSLVMAASMALTLALTAQVQTQTESTPGTATRQVTVERAEVVSVAGNNLIVKMQDGQIRDFTVPESARVTVDGKQLGIHDLKPGMKLQRTITTTTIPRTVTKVETVTGTVWQVHPPSSVILTLANGQNQQFKIPEGQKFTVDGKETDVYGLRRGQKVSATRITEVPETFVRHRQQVTGTMPPPPPAPPANAPILIAVLAPPAAPAAPAQAPAALPKTASPLPLIGLLGLLLIGSSLCLKWAHR